MNLTKNVEIIRATTARTKKASSMTSKVVDMSGYEGCCFVVCMSTLTLSSSKVKAYVGMSTISTGTFNYSVSYAQSSSGMAAGVNKRLLILDVYKPREQYLKCKVAGASSSGPIDVILALKYGPRKPGSTGIGDSTSIADSTLLISPATA